MTQVKLVGKLFWAQHMTKPNTEFNPAETRYEICIGDLSDSLVDRLKNELNVKVKEKKDDKYGRGKYIIVKTKWEIKAVDAEGNEVDPSLIGNGTLAELSVSSYSHKMTAMHGNAPSLMHSGKYPAIKIKELVAPKTKEELEAAKQEEEVVL
jgi:hypothetical protein